MELDRLPALGTVLRQGAHGAPAPPAGGEVHEAFAAVPTVRFVRGAAERSPGSMLRASAKGDACLAHRNDLLERLWMPPVGRWAPFRCEVREGAARGRGASGGLIRQCGHVNARHDSLIWSFCLAGRWQTRQSIHWPSGGWMKERRSAKSPTAPTSTPARNHARALIALPSLETSP